MSKSLYGLGEVPPLGVVPEQMYATVIRQERFGEPIKAMQTEVVPVPKPGYGEVLVYVMAAGINYNNVWASLGEPIDVIAMRQKLLGAPEDFHIGGSDGSGVVWAVGEGVEQFKVGDEVIVSGATWDETAEDVRLGVDPLAAKSLKAWGTRRTTVRSPSTPSCGSTSATPSPPICRGRRAAASWSPAARPTGS